MNGSPRTDGWVSPLQSRRLPLVEFLQFLLLLPLARCSLSGSRRSCASLLYRAVLCLPCCAVQDEGAAAAAGVKVSVGGDGDGGDGDETVFSVPETMTLVGLVVMLLVVLVERERRQRGRRRREGRRNDAAT